ncbi:MAG TPA: DHA2 family efflux MFS transporter permease subunit [Streptosporangiaceae bacterium]|nr:DHA2 family efflux MFS transporter permease subunit [Streptosporangiaceae bacterium]
MAEPVRRPPAAPPAPPESAPDRRLFALGVVVVLGTLLTSLSTTIINVATRTLGSEFGAPLTTIQWVLTGYLLAFASTIPVAGWASERFGARRVWIAALLLFTVGSALCGLSWSAGALIAFQVLRGIGAGLILPVGQGILAQAAGPRRMGRVIGMIAVPLLMGSLIGPVIGGLIISTAGWRWIFLLNLPLGLLAVLTARRLMPKSAPQPGNRLDLRGLLLLCVGVAVFIYGTSEAGLRGGLGSPHAVIGLAAGTVLIALYVVHARGRRHRALIDVMLFRERAFMASASTNLMLSVTRFGVLILMPLYWQILRGQSPLTTGVLLIPQTLGAAAAMPLGGWVVDRAGPRVVVPSGILIGMLGALAYSQLGADTPVMVCSGALFLIGLGLGVAVVPATVTAYVTLPNPAIPRATCAINTIQQLGASIGTALLAVVLQRSITAEAPELGPSALGALPSHARDALVPALERAFGQAFWVAAALIAVTLIPAMLLPRRSSVTRRSAVAEG